MTENIAKPFVPVPTIDEWAAENLPPPTYSDGQEIRVGDYVDFGRVGPGPTNEPWPGIVTGFRSITGEVLVDELTGGPPRLYHPTNLKLLSRAEPAAREAE